MIGKLDETGNLCIKSNGVFVTQTCPHGGNCHLSCALFVVKDPYQQYSHDGFPPYYNYDVYSAFPCAAPTTTIELCVKTLIFEEFTDYSGS